MSGSMTKQPPIAFDRNLIRTSCSGSPDDNCSLDAGGHLGRGPCSAHFDVPRRTPRPDWMPDVRSATSECDEDATDLVLVGLTSTSSIHNEGLPAPMESQVINKSDM